MIRLFICVIDKYLPSHISIGNGIILVKFSKSDEICVPYFLQRQEMKSQSCVLVFSYSLDSKSGGGKTDIDVQTRGRWNCPPCFYSSFFWKSYFPFSLYHLPSCKLRSVFPRDPVHGPQAWSLKTFADQFLPSMGTPQGITTMDLICTHGISPNP